MTREQTKELLPVMQAWANGGDVQVRDRSRPTDSWDTYSGSDPDFDNKNWEWRIKPEPREFWISLRGEDEQWYSCHTSRENAERYISAKPLKLRVIHVREVL